VVLAAFVLVGPALLHPGTRVAGEQGDPDAAVWQLHEMQVGRLGLLDPTTTPSANAPSGARLRRPIEVSTALFDSLALSLAKVLGPVATYNFLLLCAVISNGLAMLYLGRKLAFGALAATVSALLFASAPPLLIELHLHAALAFAFTVPLVAAFGLELSTGPGMRFAALAGATTGLAAYVNPYLPLYTGVVLAVFCAAGLVRRGRGGIKDVLVAVGSAVAVALPGMLFVLANRNQVVADTHRVISELALFSLDVGDYARAFGSLLLVVPVIACAGYGLFVLRRRTPVWWAFVVIAAAGYVLSLPPDVTVLGVTMRTPSTILFDLLPVWRVIGRSGMLVWFAAAILVGAAVTVVEARRPARPTRSRLVAAWLTGLAIVAWSVGIADKGMPWFDLDTDPPLTAMLARASGRVAEYPLFGFDNAMGPYLLRQMIHGRELFNGSIPGTDNALLAALAADSNDPQAVRALQVGGVTRIAVHPGATAPRGSVLRTTTPSGVRVYDIPRAGNPAVAVLQGGTPLERAPTGLIFSWLARPASIDVLSARPGHFALTLVAWSPRGAARTLRAGGRSIGDLNSSPRSFTLCVATQAGDRPLAGALVDLDASGPVRRLSPTDPRRATMGVGIVSVVPGCEQEGS
jgi:hypothetical protein